MSFSVSELLIRHIFSIILLFEFTYVLAALFVGQSLGCFPTCWSQKNSDKKLDLPLTPGGSHPTALHSKGKFSNIPGMSGMSHPGFLDVSMDYFMPINNRRFNLHPLNR